jgi:hypothetical protein
MNWLVPQLMAPVICMFDVATKFASYERIASRWG